MGDEPARFRGSKAEGDLLWWKISSLEQKCEALGVLERFKFRLRSARKEGDRKKLERKLSRIEKEITAIEEEALRKRLPYNLAKFFSALRDVAILSMNRVSTYENGCLTVCSVVKHFPWEEGSNEFEFETLEELYAGGEPDWLEEERSERQALTAGGGN